MKLVILQQLLDLIETNNVQERTTLKSVLVISLERITLNLPKEKETHVKNLIISTIKKYADTTDHALQVALRDHYNTLEKLIVNYC